MMNELGLWIVELGLRAAGWHMVSEWDAWEAAWKLRDRRVS
jgi:hypothetical protein